MGEAVSGLRAWEKPPMLVERLTDIGIVNYWKYISAELDRVPHIWQPHWTKDYLHSMALANGMQMWGVGPPEKMTLVVWTQVVEYPGCRALQVVLAIGTGIDEALPALEHELLQFAQLTGCEICEVIGRRGWWPRLKHNGFRRRGEVFMRKIENRSVN
jgi:hypothetical protein